MIKVENITKSFIVSGVKNHLKAVNNVSLEVKKGEIVCLIGPSGSGKSTLLRCIEGLEVPEKGNIRIMIVTEKQYANIEIIIGGKSNQEQVVTEEVLLIL